MQEAKDLIQIRDLHKVFKIKGRDVIAILASKKANFLESLGFPAPGKALWFAASTS